MKKKKELDVTEAMLPQAEEQDVPEDFDLFIPGDEPEQAPQAQADPEPEPEAGPEAVAEPQKPDKPDEPEDDMPQGPPPPPAAAPAPARTLPPPKAYIRPRPDTKNLSYGCRAAMYLSDKDEYRSMIGGSKQWK